MLPADMNLNTMNTSNSPNRKCSLLLTAALVAVVFCTPSTTPAQNLVPNPGFEETDSCTFGLGLGELMHWYSASITPDHLQSCQPYGSVNGLPMNTFTFQQPFDGTSCSGIHTYIPIDWMTEQREWLMVSLLDTLVPGQTYFCSFRANAAFGGTLSDPTVWLASSRVGMLFTTYDREWTWGDPYPPVFNYSHIEYPQILSDTVGWTLVSGSFLADSAYTYLMIGNFYGNALTDTLRFADPANVEEWYDISYTLIDAVCVSTSPKGCDVGQGVLEPMAGQTLVYPNPAIDALVVGNARGRDAVVLDILGQRVWSGRVDGDRFRLDVRGYPRGAYVLQVHGERGVQIVKFVLAE